MYFYSIDKVKDELASGPLPERAGMPYAIASAVTVAIATSIPVEYNTSWDYAQTVFALVAIFLGTLWLYKQNGGDSGREFIHRYTILGWVVSVRYVTFISPLFILLVGILYFTGVLSDETTSIDFILASAAEVLFFVYFGKHLKDLAARTTKTRPPNQAL